MSNEYFCSYMVFKRGAVFGYGDLIFKSEVNSANELLGNIKNHIKKKYYDNEENIRVVITSLNKL